MHGNIDSAELRRMLPERQVVEAGGARIAMVHDAGPAKGRLRRMRMAFPECDAVVFGHSHIPLHEEEDGFQIFNPGSPTDRRRPPRHTMGARAGGRRPRELRARLARLAKNTPVDLDVMFLGTAGSAPTAARGLPATLVRRGGDRLLFDCGEGTQRQLLRSIGLVDLEEIFLTHFHADHFLGLPGMLKTFGLRGREAPLTIYGPRGLRALFEALRPVIGGTPLRRAARRARAERRRSSATATWIAPFAVDHRVARVRLRAGRGRPARAASTRTRARELGVEPGPDFGRLQRGETVSRRRDVLPEQVMGEARRGRKVVLDRRHRARATSTRAVAHGADLLVHEATFTAEEAERAAETGHSTARGAAELAAAAEVALLALTHVSPRYPAEELRDEAREVFERHDRPARLRRVEIPFPERGRAGSHAGESRVPSPTGCTRRQPL